MKIIKVDVNKYGEKVNFVDENNVFVGYDMYSECCEEFGWFISDKIETEIFDKGNDEKIKRPTYIVENYIFDTYFFKEIRETDFNEENIVVFKLKHKTIKNTFLYLHLYNCHNGYYSHGFEYKINDKIVREGDL